MSKVISKLIEATLRTGNARKVVDTYIRKAGFSEDFSIIPYNIGDKVKIDSDEWSGIGTITDIWQIPGTSGTSTDHYVIDVTDESGESTSISVNDIISKIESHNRDKIGFSKEDDDRFDGEVDDKEDDDDEDDEDEDKEENIRYRRRDRR